MLETLDLVRRAEPGPPLAAPAGARSRRRDDRPAMPGEGSGPSLRLGRGAGRGPPAVPEGRPDPRQAQRRGGARVSVGEAQPGGLGPGGGNRAAAGRRVRGDGGALGGRQAPGGGGPARERRGRAALGGACAGPGVAVVPVGARGQGGALAGRVAAVRVGRRVGQEGGGRNLSAWAGQVPRPSASWPSPAGRSPARPPRPMVCRTSPGATTDRSRSGTSAPCGRLSEPVSTTGASATSPSGPTGGSSSRRAMTA